jgi:ribosomal RNA assembly protein|tara:strand:- start:2439 stop:2981 length:543 start_codon:yes stop_codon:yes gene_type:complete
VVKLAEYVKIPEERLDLLLADQEKIKKLVENSTNTQIELDKETCEVIITAGKDNDDPLSLWRARDVVKAIGRGFEPELALELLDPDKEFKIITLTQYAGKSKNSLIRIRSRIIGSEGKSKRHIEDITQTHMVIYGKTVCIIGSVEQVHLAARAVDMLASGSKHGSVYKMLEQESIKLLKS